MQTLRILSLTTLFLVLAIGLLPDVRDSACVGICSIGAALSILFPRLSREEKQGRIRTVAYVQAALAPGTMTLASVLGAGSALMALLFAVAVVVPVSFRLVAAGLDTASDTDSLCSEARGWEVSIYYGNVMHVSMSVFLYLVSLITSVFMEGSMPGYVSAGVMSVTYAYMYLRSIAGEDNALARDLRIRMKDRVKNMLLPDRGRDISVNYRMLYDRIREYMETKQPYLNPSFCLEDMSKAMYTNSGYISRMINTCTGGNFSQFVNAYRVRYAMDLYRRDMSLKVTELAQLSGFNTKVTFNMAFKLVAKETPGQWCRHLQESMQKAGDLSNRTELHM